VKHLALVGATATGKSHLALECARRLGDVEIVSADSMQVYRGMDIGTAKPTPAERAEVPHHLLDLVDPAAEFSVADFQAAARTAIASIEERGRRALVVGGTGLYVRALVDDLDIPGRWPEIRSELEAEATTIEGVRALHDRLAGLDPTAAARMEPTNRRRVVRALEVCLGSGRPFSSFGPGLDTYRPSQFDQVGIRVDRPRLDRRIAERVHGMFTAGLVEEVRALSARPLSRTARQALGYKALLAHLAGGTALSEAVEETIRRTCWFARRQERWFRRDPRIRWLEHDGNHLAVLPDLLRDWMQCG